MTKLSLSDLAVREKLSYQQTYERALRGDLGQIVRDGRRWFVVVPDGDRDRGADE